MKKRVILTVLLAFVVLIIQINAQDDEIIVLQAGDPPLVERISLIALDDAPYAVLITGEAGAVFPSAQVAVRNIYTGATIYTQANFDGSFSATVAGIANLPYQIQVDTRFDQSITPETLSGIGVVLHPPYEQIFGQGIPFGLGGNLSYGAGTWYAEGTINAVDFAQGDTASISLDVAFLIDDFDPSLDYVMRGELGFRRYFDENGTQLSTAIGTGNDWSSELTSTGLPILGRIVPDTFIADAITDDILIDETTGIVTFSFEFESSLDDLLSGIHAPVFIGEVSVNGSEFVDWDANRIFSADGQSQGEASPVIIPLLLSIGDITSPELNMTILGQLPLHPSVRIGLYTTNLQQATSFEPTILGFSDEMLVLPLQNRSFFWNLEQFAIQGGARDDLAQLVIVDNQLRVSTLVDSFSYNPDNLAEYYDISFTSHIVDAFGRSYRAGGQYYLDNIDTATFQSAVFSGTPLMDEQAYAYTGTVSPIIAPSLGVFVGRPSTNTRPNSGSFGLNVNRFGYYYNPPETFTFGYYNMSYRSNGAYQLSPKSHWGLTSIANTFANGRYGLADYDSNPQAWFDTASYPTNAPDILPFVNFPYFSGDVAYIPDGENAGINPVLSGGDYQYVSIVRADGILRQFARDSNATFDAHLSNDDLLNGRIGAGSEGNRPNDVLWLFGAVIDESEVRGYSSIAVVTDDESARVVPPFTEFLLFDRGEAVDLFVLPTGVRAGQVLETGDTFAMIGYLAPTVSADVTTTIVTPSETIANTTQASPFGYFYEPEHDFTVTENGVYTVYVDATYAGETSAGLLPEPVYGTVLGADNSSYLMFVVDRDAPMLLTNRESVSTVASGQAFSISLIAPDDWSDVSTYYVVRTAQQILEQGELDTFSNQASYTFNWAELARLFPNLEAFATAPSDMDEVTLSFAMTGNDANGTAQTQARIFTLRGNTLYTADE